MRESGAAEMTDVGTLVSCEEKKSGAEEDARSKDYSQDLFIAAAIFKEDQSVLTFPNSLDFSPLARQEKERVSGLLTQLAQSAHENLNLAWLDDQKMKLLRSLI